MQLPFCPSRLPLNDAGAHRFAAARREAAGPSIVALVTTPPSAKHSRSTPSCWLNEGTGSVLWCPAKVLPIYATALGGDGQMFGANQQVS